MVLDQLLDKSMSDHRANFVDLVTPDSFELGSLIKVLEDHGLMMFEMMLKSNPNRHEQQLN